MPDSHAVLDLKFVAKEEGRRVHQVYVMKGVSKNILTVLACSLAVAPLSHAALQPLDTPYTPSATDSSVSSISSAPMDSGTSPEESVKLYVKASFLTPRAAVGDTVVYRLRVEWKDTQVPVVVLAPDSLETPGFRIVDQSATHRQSVENGEVQNATEFLYKLMADVPGGARVSSLKLRYLTGFSNREEALYVPASYIDVDPAHVPLWKRLWFQILVFLILATALVLWGRRMLRSLREKRRLAQAEKQRGFNPEVRALKGRWNTADSRVWIEDAERVCTDFLRHSLGINSPGNRFETLLEQYLARNPASEEVEAWNKLRELFHHARYAGGRKEPHELQENYRILKTCLHIQGENE
jgi:hypothetical protein